MLKRSKHSPPELNSDTIRQCDGEMCVWAFTKIDMHLKFSRASIWNFIAITTQKIKNKMKQKPHKDAKVLFLAILTHSTEYLLCKKEEIRHSD